MEGVRRYLHPSDHGEALKHSRFAFVVLDFG